MYIKHIYRPLSFPSITPSPRCWSPSSWWKPKRCSGNQRCPRAVVDKVHTRTFCCHTTDTLANTAAAMKLCHQLCLKWPMECQSNHIQEGLIECSHQLTWGATCAVKQQIFITHECFADEHAVVFYFATYKIVFSKPRVDCKWTLWQTLSALDGMLRCSQLPCLLLWKRLNELNYFDEITLAHHTAHDFEMQGVFEEHVYKYAWSACTYI